MNAKRIRRGVGTALALGCLAGLLHSLRASAAYLLYFRSKYGPRKDDPAFVERADTAAWKLYPYNVNACLWAARANYAEGLTRSGPDRDSFMRRATAWCERGVALNPHDRDLRRLQTLLTKETDLPRAIEIWETYTAWDRWEPDNYVFLMSLYAEAGETGKAERVMTLLASRPEACRRARIYAQWLASRTGAGNGSLTKNRSGN